MFSVTIGLGFLIYSHWSTFIITTIEWQKTLHAMLGSYINSVSEDAVKYGTALIATSFGYGVFHAIGPGHGKAVIVTYLSTNKEGIWKGIIISFSAALLQSIVAITLVSTLARMLKFKLAEVHNYGNDVALVSYVLVMMLGVMLLAGSIQRLIKSYRSRGQSTSDKHAHNAHEHTNHVHTHDDDCGCSHSHVPAQNESIWQTLTVILSMGFRPCSGAIVVLIYAHLVGVYTYGVIATLVMGVGTGVSVSLIAACTLFARSWLEKLANESNKRSFYARLSISHYIRFIGGVVLILLGWSLYSTASALSAGHPLF
jgi:ABC-type nickel/cobalt efflux system permease component RcnA